MGLKLSHAYGQTPLDEDEREGLKIKSISTQKELDEFEQLNIEKAILWTIRTKPKTENILTEKFIRTLHQRCMVMFGNGPANLEGRKKILELLGPKFRWN